jgi:predicted ATP-binding protein involved in virulence
MRLSKIALENFRCFAALELDLHPQMTVLVAENGLGKSSVLDAIRIALWPFVSSFDLAKSRFNDPSYGISIDDIRLLRMNANDMARQLPTKVIVTGDFGSGPNCTWIRYRDQESEHSKTKDAGDTAFMRQRAKDFQAQIRTPEKPTLNLPVFGYYGTGRLYANKKLTQQTRVKDDSTKTDFYIRTFGYRNCLDPASSFQHFKEWFGWASSARKEMIFTLDESPLSGGPKLSGPSNSTQDARILSGIEDQLAVVRQSIDTMLQAVTGWHGLEYSFFHERSLILHHPEHGIMKVDALSDGVRNMLAMVGDIAYRCVKLNPHLGGAAARETAGVVLIDEIDMHLHPRWQQVVVGQLQQAFPRIQFVATTHSPQVISSVPSENIRILHEGGVHLAPPGTEGAESARILKRVFLVDPRPQENQATKELNEYLQLVYSDEWASPRAIELRSLLDARYQGEEPALTEADLYIENREWEKSIEGDKDA